MLEKEFIPYQEALALKKLGFDEPCLFLYNSTDDEPKPFLASPTEAMDWNTLYIEKTNKHLMSAPTYSQAFRWFREKYRLDGKPVYFLNDWYCFIINDMKGTETNRRLFTEYPSYEEAELACLDKLIEIVKNQ